MNLFTNIHTTTIDLAPIATNASSIINTVLGALSGLIALSLVIMAIFYFVKLSSNAGNVERRQRYLSALKWVGIAFVGILLIWGISASAVTIMQSSLTT